MFAFLYVKVNSKESAKKYPFLLFSEKILMSAFLLRFKANYFKKMSGYPQFFFVDSNKTLYLVGSVLNSSVPWN